MTSENIMFWNVRGLNSRARRNSVREFVVHERVSLLCLQETKMVDVTRELLNDMLGSAFDYCFLPSVGMAGGILVAWSTDVWTLTDISFQQFSVTTKAALSSIPSKWFWMTIVHGPREDSDKVLFL